MCLNFQSNSLDDNISFLATTKLTEEDKSNRKLETKMASGKPETRTAKEDHGKDAEPKYLEHNLTLA